MEYNLLNQLNYRIIYILVVLPAYFDINIHSHEDKKQKLRLHGLFRKEQNTCRVASQREASVPPCGIPGLSLQRSHNAIHILPGLTCALRQRQKYATRR